MIHRILTAHYDYVEGALSGSKGRTHVIIPGAFLFFFCSFSSYVSWLDMIITGGSAGKFEGARTSEEATLETL